MATKEELTFRYWKNGFYENYKGIVKRVDRMTNHLHVKSEVTMEYISIDCIVDIN
ncbi:YolD-like family protein [Evansella cellulosilytica]|uniref:YolD-like family protein n=1 Tax=Evansella cellulosilytica TaxID=1413 RepID=UPI0009D72B7C